MVVEIAGSFGPRPRVESGWRHSDHREGRSKPECLPSSLDGAQEDGLRGTLWNPPSAQVDVEGSDGGDEDARERSELLDAAS